MTIPIKGGVKTIISSAAVTSSGVSEEFALLDHVKSLIVQLDVTAAATEVGDILAVWLQGTVDGTNFYDIGRFADILGNGNSKRYVMVLNREYAAESELITPTDAAMSASTVGQGPFPDTLRVKYTVTDAGADNASFTFGIVINSIR
ncbi:MAG: hypothetical protein M0R80_04240 [Proteobacteria bacterium]|jgi:hypothetical protein|nr:hypothetical protein [Pseudomonadota bacterium]